MLILEYMEAISIILTTLAAKSTLNCIVETIYGGLIEKIVFDKMPSLTRQLLTEFKDKPTLINQELQKAILSSHWLATKVLAERMKEKSKLNHEIEDAFVKILNVSDAKLGQLKSKNNQPQITPEIFRNGELILNNLKLKETTSLKEAVLEFHLAELRIDCGRVVELDGYVEFENNIRSSSINETFDWFELVSAFFNDLLIGDNNKAKDAFQNLTLTKIGADVNEVKSILTNFEILIEDYIHKIGKENFESFKLLVTDDLIDVKKTLMSITDSLIDIKDVLTNFSKNIDLIVENERRGLNKFHFDFDKFPDYRTILEEIEKLNLEFEEIQSKQQETIEFLVDETNENKKRRFEKDLSDLNQDLIRVDSQRVNKNVELLAFKEYIEQTWLSLYKEKINISQRLINARILFEKGDLSGANAQLDSKSLENEYESIAKVKEIAKQKQEALSQDYLTKANFTVLEKSDSNWFEDAKKYYLRAVELHETYDTYFAFAYFLQSHNQILDAEIMSEKMLQHANDEVKKSTALNNLAVLQKALNKIEDAEINYNKALVIKRDLARANPQKFLYSLAATLNNLAILQNDINEFKKSEENLKEVLSIYRDLVSHNPQAYSSFMALTLNNLGNLYRVINDFEKSKVNLEESLEIYKKLAKDNPENHLSNVAMVLNNLGNLQRASNNINESKLSYEESLTIRKNLADKNPKTYLADVALTLNNLGNLFRIINDFESSQKSFKEALVIYRELAENNRQVYLSFIAATLNSWAVLNRVANEFEESEKKLEEVLSIYRELATNNPQTYLDDVAATLSSWAVLHRLRNNFESSESKFKEALTIYRKLVADNPEAYLPSLAMNLNNLGNLYRNKNEFNQAKECYTEALSIRRSLAKNNPEAYLPDVAMTLANLGNLQGNINEIREGKWSFDEAIKIFLYLSKKIRVHTKFYWLKHK